MSSPSSLRNMSVRRREASSIIGAIMAFGFGSIIASPEPTGARAVEGALARLRVPFVRNDGQTDPDVAYTAATFAGTVFVTRRGEILYSLRGAPGWVLRETLAGGRPIPTVGTPGTSRVSRYIGDDPSAWRSGIPTYDDVCLGEVWPGIRVRLAARGDSVEKIFEVGPGEDAARIRVRLEGAVAIRRGADGSLIARTGPGEVRLSPPEAWQEKGDVRVPVAVAYAIEGTQYGFLLGGRDPDLPVIIDPILQSTYLGGSAEDRGYGVAIYPIGVPPLGRAVYVTGVTQSTDLPAGPVPGAQPASGGGRDVFVACLDPELTELISMTYLGGSGDDYPGGGGGGAPIAIHIGKVYVTGNTTSGDFPIPNASPVQGANAGGTDAFVARLNSDLWTLERATYLGGSGLDAGFAIAGDPEIERDAYVYIVGQTTSLDLPGRAGGYQSAHGGSLFDAFVARLHYGLESEDPDPLRLTYVGGSGLDKGYGIALDRRSGEVYVVGETTSDNLRDGPSHLPDAAQLSNAGGSDAFVARIAPRLENLRNITYFGGTSTDQGLAIAVHPDSGDVFITGTTSSDSIPGLGDPHMPPQRELRGVRDAFVAGFAADLGPGAWATYLGGGESEQGYAIAFSATGESVYVAGDTMSDDFPWTRAGAQESNAGGGDAFVARIRSDLRGFEQSTYLGGSGQDMGLGIAVNPESGDVYVAGLTSSQDYPRTEGGAQAVHAGGPAVFRRDAYVARLDAGLGTRSIDVSPLALTFPYIWFGDRWSLEVEIANHGTRTLAVSDFELSDATNYACRTGAPPACPDPPFSLAPGESQVLEVEYAPPAPGEHRAQLTIVSDDPTAPRVTVSLIGGAVADRWITQTLGPGVGSVDLAIDPSHRIHLCTFAPPTMVRGPTLRYATYLLPDPPPPHRVDRPDWTIEALAELSSTGTDCSIAAASDGTCHIAYIVDEKLYYLRRGSAPLLLAEGVTPECAIALDADQVPSIAFSQYSEYSPPIGLKERPLPYCAYVPVPDIGAVRISLIPGIDMPGRTGGARGWCDLAYTPEALEIPWALFDVDGTPVLYEIDPGELRFPPDGPALARAFRAPDASPAACRIGITGSVPHGFVLAGIDPADGSVSVQRLEITAHGVAYHDVPLWTTMEYFIAGGGATDDDIHIAANPPSSGHVSQVAFYDRQDTALKYLYVNDIWTSFFERCPIDTCGHGGSHQLTETVDETGDVGKSPGIVEDSEFFIHIAYLDETKGTVRYARNYSASGTTVMISPSRWHFRRAGDWRAFFINRMGHGECILRDIRIENAGPGDLDDWRILRDCDEFRGDPTGEDLGGPDALEWRAFCVEIAPDAVGPSRADLVVETSARTVRAQLVYGLFPPDGDCDGAWDADEADGGDGNGDGVPDVEQDHVANARALDSRTRVTVSCPERMELRDVAVVANPSPDDAPAGVAFPFGFLRF
ncbi:MAG: hypothetical protein JXP34_06920, partial [Planctomycetes bacterium]|nr:hypothetical protein [Planctomycetota bacterium]